jgi:hypothetical protein
MTPSPAAIAMSFSLQRQLMWVDDDDDDDDEESAH